MAKYTENYNLEKPDKTEYYDIETANKNNDIIDGRLFSKQDKQAGKGLSTNDFTNAYKQKIDALQRIYKYCGSVETVSNLDTIEERQIGDVYNVKDTNIDYCWNGTVWTELGNAVDLTNYQTTEQANQDKQKIKDKLVVVSPTEPTGDNREKVWIQKTDTEQKIYVLNDNGVYDGVRIKDENARQDIQTLKNKNNRKMILIGDSYCELNSDNDITKFYWEYLRDNLGLTQNVDFFSAFQSGAGFGNGLFLTKLQTLESLITNKEEITDIFICGGWNDSRGTDETYDTQVDLFNTYVKTNYPNARVTIGHISWGNPIMTQTYNVFTELPISTKRYKETCNKYGWRYLTGVEHILHNYNTKYWQTDGSHPSQKGQERLGKNLVAPFLTGSCDVFESESLITLTADGIVSEIKNTVSYNYLKNDVTQVVLASTALDIACEFVCDKTIVDCSGNHIYKLGKLNSPFLAGFSSTNLANASALLYGTVNGVAQSYLVNTTFFVDKGDLWIRPYIKDGLQYVTNLSIITVLINGLKFTNPTIIS